MTDTNIDEAAERETWRDWHKPDAINCPVAGFNGDCAVSLNAWLARARIAAQREADIEERERMRLAGISTAALGYWKEGDSIHADYDTVAIRDVAKLYAKYNELLQREAELRRDEERLREKVDAVVSHMTGALFRADGPISRFIADQWHEQLLAAIAKEGK